MDNHGNTFFAGRLNNLGFGSYNAIAKNINQYYSSLQNNSIEKYFQKPPSNVPHSNYVPNSNRCLPELTPHPLVDFSDANAVKLNPMAPTNFKTFDNYRFLNSMPKAVPETNFSPALIRMQCLHDQIRAKEMQNMAQQERLQSELEAKFIGNGRFKQFLQNNSREISKHNLRRIETKRKLEEMRKSIHGQATDTNGDDDDDSFSTHKSKQPSPERRSPTKKPSVINSQVGQMPVNLGVSPTKARKNSLAIELNPILPESKPDPFVEQLRYERDKMDNFTKGLTAELEGLKEDIRRKMDSVEQKQQENVELFKFVLEHGGNNKLKASAQKVFERREIDLDEVEEEIPEYVKEFPKLIDKKVAEYEEMRKEEEKRQSSEMKEREKQHEIDLKARNEEIRKEVEERFRKKEEEEKKKKEEEAKLVLPPIDTKKKKNKKKKNAKQPQEEEENDDVIIIPGYEDQPFVNQKPKKKKKKKKPQQDEEPQEDEELQLQQEPDEEEEQPKPKKKKKKLIEPQEEEPENEQEPELKPKKKTKKKKPIEPEEEEPEPEPKLKKKKTKKAQPIEPEEAPKKKRPKTGKKKKPQ